MDVTRSEEEQIEALKKWWADNGWALVGGVVIGLAAIFGWRGWQNHQALQAEAASDIYVDLVSEIREQRYSTAREHAETIISEYPSTTYAQFAILMLAKLDAEAGKIDTAIQSLEEIIDRADQQPMVKLATLRKGRLLLDSGKPEEAMALLKTIEPGQFMVAYQELRGDIHVQLGNTNVAHEAYTSALAAIDNNLREVSLLEFKLDATRPQD